MNRFCENWTRECGRILSIGLVVLFSAFGAANAATVTSNVKVELVSMWEGTGDLLVQTSPKHTLDAGCTNDYWILVESDSTVNPAYETMLAMILSAQARQASITVEVTGYGNQFCKLTRIINLD